MKVYVVTDGEYSDYHIECVTLSLDAAYEYIKRRSGEVETYDTEDLDRYLSDKRSCWSVHNERGIIRARLLTDVAPCDDHGYRWCHVRRAKWDGHLFVNVKAHTKEKAEKIATDLFTEYEAKKAGVS